MRYSYGIDVRLLEQSIGVRAEIKLAESLGIPVEYKRMS